ncbi:hypothetical protein YYE_03981 [Plasmodium vinckei vinckei]|uniref:Uncharacterized protein n=1 Tax=Plasmodium vinckei vinckei TaxID=54757 RepID=A0A081ICI3_PLAVN|nr:hypothetical protein YYE_03981 [Plasmodium vinckei vinckei]
MFYTQCIEIDVEYTTPIENGTIYNICKNLINNKKELVNIRIKYMAKFYDVFKMLYTTLIIIMNKFRHRVIFKRCL